MFSRDRVIGAVFALALVAIVWNVGAARNVVFPTAPRI
jgi:hypothetical protein